MEHTVSTYALVMETPLGKRRGVLRLCLLDDGISGELTLFTRTTPIREACRSGSRFSFQGEMRTLMGTLPYQASGTLRESTLEMEIRTARGNYPAKGVRTEKRRD